MYIPTLYVDKESQTLQGATERRGKVEPEEGMYTYVYCVCVFCSVLSGNYRMTCFTLKFRSPSLPACSQLESSLPRTERKLAMQKAKSEALMKRQENVRQKENIFIFTH